LGQHWNPYQFLLNSILAFGGGGSGLLGGIKY